MALESGTYVSDLVTTNPPTSDNVSQGDDHIKLLKTVLQSTFPGASKAFYFPTAAAKTANYTILSSEMFKFFTGSGASTTVTFTLPSLASGDAGWFCVVQAIDITNTVKISGTINGATDLTFTIVNQVALVWWTGSAWRAQLSPVATDINGLTAETSPDVADLFIIYDASAGTNDKMTFANFLKVINGLTADGSPDLSADYVATWDNSASAAKKVLLSNLVAAASDTAAGKQENAVQSEMEAASSTTLTVTPGRVHYHPGVAKCWAKFTAAGSLSASYNMTSVTQDSQGDWTVTIATDFSSANYVIVLGLARDQNFEIHVVTQAAGSFTLKVQNASSGADSDPDSLFFAAFGDH